MGCGPNSVQGKPYEIHGFVKPGFEEVKRQFEEYYANGIDKHSQLCVYVGDTMVVDLWGTQVIQKGKKQHYTADSVTNIWSSGKSIGALLMAVMRD